MLLNTYCLYVWIGEVCLWHLSSESLALVVVQAMIQHLCPCLLYGSPVDSALHLRTL